MVIVSVEIHKPGVLSNAEITVVSDKVNSGSEHGLQDMLLPTTNAAPEMVSQYVESEYPLIANGTPSHTCRSAPNSNEGAIAIEIPTEPVPLIGHALSEKAMGM